MSEQNNDLTAVQKAHTKQSFFATKPTRGTVFLRTFVPWQMWRFLRINLKMMTIIARSHKPH